jgi:hypothetical protein
MSNQVNHNEIAADVSADINPSGSFKIPAWTKDDLKEVTLYQMKVSPPCVKIRAIL